MPVEVLLLVLLHGFVGVRSLMVVPCTVPPLVTPSLCLPVASTCLWRPGPFWFRASLSSWKRFHELSVMSPAPCIEALRKSRLMAGVHCRRRRHALSVCARLDVSDRTAIEKIPSCYIAKQPENSAKSCRWTKCHHDTLQFSPT